MTYCVALTLNAGLVFASDSRTNAGVDYVTTFSKMSVFRPAEDRLFVILTAGNLATTQEVLYRLQRDLGTLEGSVSLRTVRYLFEAAEYVGRVSREVQRQHAAALQQSGFSGEASFIIGGQLRGQPHGIFLVYPQGNFISASPQTPYLQIGELKYGKPVLDRFIDPNLSLEDGSRLALVSLDATIHSNISVGPPLEVSLYARDRFQISHRLKLDLTSPFYAGLQAEWQQGLSDAFQRLPRFEWESRVREESVATASR
jgi:putative proteasome-type protease